MTKLKELERTGRFQNGTTVDDLIKHLSEYKSIYGNNPIYITLFGGKEVTVQFDYYADALTIDVMEDE